MKTGETSGGNQRRSKKKKKPKPTRYPCPRREKENKTFFYSGLGTALQEYDSRKSRKDARKNEIREKTKTGVPKSMY